MPWAKFNHHFYPQLATANLMAAQIMSIVAQRNIENMIEVDGLTLLR